MPGSTPPARLADCPGFWTTWTASTVSGFGSYVTGLALSVLVVVDLGGGATEVGLVNSAGWLPYLVFGLLTGVLVDRVRRRPLLIVTDLGRAVLLAAIPALALIGRLQIGWLVTLVALVGLLALLHDAAFQAFVPRLVPRRLLTPAHARLDQATPWRRRPARRWPAASWRCSARPPRCWWTPRRSSSPVCS